MPGITNPAEEYFKDGLWGWVATAWNKLVADTSGFLKINVAAQDIDVEVTQTTAADLTPGVCGWDGSAWRKLPLVWGYSETLQEEKKDLDASVTSDILAGTAVPAGEVWVVDAVCAVDTTTNITLIRFAVDTVIGGIFFHSAVPGAADEYIYWDGHLVLTEGKKIVAFFAGTVAGDDIYLRYSGHKMKIAE